MEAAARANERRRNLDKVDVSSAYLRQEGEL